LIHVNWWIISLLVSSHAKYVGIVHLSKNGKRRKVFWFHDTTCLIEEHLYWTEKLNHRDTLQGLCPVLSDLEEVTDVQIDLSIIIFKLKHIKRKELVTLYFKVLQASEFTFFYKENKQLHNILQFFCSLPLFLQNKIPSQTYQKE